MKLFENDYLSSVKQLINKYGEAVFFSPTNRSAAISLLSNNFKYVPESTDLNEEIKILSDFTKYDKGKILRTYNLAYQDNFRLNRLQEIVKYNSHLEYFNNPDLKTLNQKIIAAEKLGLKFPANQNQILKSGHRIGELVADLYKHYLLEYQLYRIDNNLAIFRHSSENDSNEKPSSINSNSDKISYPNDKKCPYCFESINKDAIKCKHCGEWLNKQKKASVIEAVESTIKKGINSIQEKVDKRKAARYSHIFIPTNTNPISYRNLEIYPSYLKLSEKRIDFDEIFGIQFYSSSMAVNGFDISSTILFKLLYSKEDKSEIEPENSRFLTICNTQNEKVEDKREVELIFHIKNILSDYTFKSRINRYLKQIKLNGCFIYLDKVTFYNNGDIETENGKKSNIKVAHEAGLLGLGTISRSFKTTSSDPYKFIIHKNNGPKISFMGIDFFSKIEFDCMYNQDCIEFIVSRIINHGKIID